MDNYHKKKRADLYVAFIVCSISVLIFGSTEILSLFHAINTISIRGFWIFCVCIVVICWIAKARKTNIVKLKNSILHWINVGKGKWDIILLITGWLLFLGYLSFKTVPNNYDSMTYHLARVANWMQNQSVDYYPTNILRQLYSPVFSEYVILHVILFFGNDYAVNLVQYISYILCLYFIWNILKRLGCSDSAAALADILFATMPIAIAESITTQVDLAGCMWLLLFVDVIIQLIDLRSLKICQSHFIIVMICAVSIAFGYLTKSNVCFIMLPFLGWLLLVCIKRKDGLKILLFYAVSAAAGIALLSSPIFIRNQIYAGNIFAASQVSGIMVGTIKPHYLLVNIYKNFTLLAASYSSRDFLAALGVKFANLLGVNIDASEISLTGDFYDKLPVSYHHDTANNPVVAWTFLIAVIILMGLIFLKKKMNNKNFIFVCITAVILAFSSLRYQVWGSRLLLTACAVMCMVSAIVLEYLHLYILKNTVKNRLYVYIAVCAVIFAVPAVQYNKQYADMYRKEDNRFKMYFANRDVYEPYKEICDYVKALGATKIGIFLETDTYEYPLWLKLKNERTKIIQVVPESVTEVPECIIAINRGAPVGCEFSYADIIYTCIYNYEEDDSYAILVPK